MPDNQLPLPALVFSYQADEEVTFFADLILPLPIPNLFTYRVPRAMTDGIKIGARVIVPFGKKNSRVLTAIVARLHNTPPLNIRRDIFSNYWMITR